jgi:hypothetical protein
MMPPLNAREQDVLELEAEIISDDLVEEFEEMWAGDRKEDDYAKT